MACYLLDADIESGISEATETCMDVIVSTSPGVEVTINT